MYVSTLNFLNNPVYIYRQKGSLAGAAHLLKNNTDDLRSIQYEQKSHVEFKCISGFDFDLQFFFRVLKGLA